MCSDKLFVTSKLPPLQMFYFSITSKEMEKEYIRQEKIVHLEEAENERKRRHRREQQLRAQVSNQSSSQPA